MTIQQVQLSNTFNEFRTTTNLVIDEVNKLSDGTGNLVINSVVTDALSANNSTTNTLKLPGTITGYVQLKAASAGTSTLYTLPASDGLNGQILQTNGTGSLSWVNQAPGGGGGGGGGSGTSTSRVAYTSTPGQTTYTTTYAVGQVDVYMNGSKLIVGNDFTATDGANVVLTIPASAGDVVELVVYSSQWITNGSNLYYANGSIGVGTTNPAAKIHVASANTAFAVGTVRIDGADSAGTVNAPVTINAVTGGGTGNGGSQLYFETRAENGALTERVRIDQTGKVGIGTVSPTEVLEVNGTAKATTFVGAFSGSGAQLTNIDAANVTTGTLANARTTASSANGASTIVARDAAGNFSANTLSITSISSNVNIGAAQFNTVTLTSGSLILNNNLNVNSGKYFFDQANTRLGINTSTPSVDLDINTTAGVKVPVGSTAQRPTGAAGIVRHNTDASGLEFHDGTNWKNVTSDVSMGKIYFISAR